jgi:hypothetical protein
VNWAGLGWAVSRMRISCTKTPSRVCRVGRNIGVSMGVKWEGVSISVSVSVSVSNVTGRGIEKGDAETAVFRA